MVASEGFYETIRVGNFKGQPRISWPNPLRHPDEFKAPPDSANPASPQVSPPFGASFGAGSVENASGGPVTARPIGIIQVGTHDPLGSGGVYELTPAHIDAHMAFGPAGFEKNQVAGGKLAFAHGAAHAFHRRGGGGQVDSQTLTKGDLDKSRAIDPPFGSSAVTVGHALPLPVLVGQQRFDGSVAEGIRVPF